jgi:hypothetical protein
MTRFDNRILAHSHSNGELARLYEIIKSNAKVKGVFLSKELENVFREYVAKHKLGEINEQLKRKAKDGDNV